MSKIKYHDTIYHFLVSYLIKMNSEPRDRLKQSTCRYHWQIVKVFAKVMFKRLHDERFFFWIEKVVQLNDKSQGSKLRLLPIPLIIENIKFGLPIRTLKCLNI